MRKHKTFKRTLSLLLCMIMVFGSAPLAGLVGIDLPSIGELFAQKADATTEYTEGYYTYTVTDGKVTITDVVTSISGNITIPSTLGGYPVTSIDYGAFEYCSSLESVTIPNSVTSIGWVAFSDCTSLESITIPDSVTSIGTSAFAGCASLASITIPNSVTSIGGYAFEETAYYNNESNWENDVLYIGNHLIKAKYTISGSYAVKYGTKTIADYAFSGTSLESITIPDSVTSIGSEAFYNCTSLESVTIPNSVTSIGNLAFYYCTSLESITVDGNNENYSSDEYGVLFNKNKTELIQYPIGNSRTSYTIPNSVTSIGSYAFRNCTSLESITIPNSVTSIGEDAFNGCTSLESITIPDSVTSIRSHAFKGCTSLESITIPNSVTSIGDSVFYDCTSLTSIIIPNSVTSISYFAFERCTSLESIMIPNSVTSIGDSAFAECTSLASITIPNSVTSIGGGAFYGCTNLTNITIPNSVTSIGDGAFYETAYYKNIANWGNDVLYIENHLIDAKETISGSYVIKNGTKTIANSAFSSCSSLENITIPDSVTIIGGGAFYNCTSLESVTIPESVTRIDGGTFCCCVKLKNIAIPDSVTSIGEIAFGDCTNLESITLPDSVTNIDYLAFCNTAYYNNESNWENNVLYIGNHLIKAKETISGSYAVKDGTKIIADGAFYECTSLASITIPDSVTSIGDAAFEDCTSLESVTIPDSVTSINWGAFYNCTSLTDVYYTGTKSEWNAITIDNQKNEYLTNATIHFNSVMPTTPTDPDVVIQPSQSSISYGDSIILHVDASKIPAGGYVKWTADNGNFSYDASADGSTCKITTKSSGTTTFTATVYDKDGNVVSSDIQQMKSNADIFEKIIAFFKKLFGLTKTYPNTFKYIF